MAAYRIWSVWYRTLIDGFEAPTGAINPPNVPRVFANATQAFMASLSA